MTDASPKSDAIKGGLYDLLAKKLPMCVSENGTLSVADLAEALKMSPEGVYRWLRADEISKRGLRKLTELSHTDANLAAGAKLSTVVEFKPLTDEELRAFL